MELDKMLPAMMGGLTAMIGLAAVASMAQAGTPTPPAVLYCPVCNESFTSYDELYQHFTSQHPSDPIEIIWE